MRVCVGGRGVFVCVVVCVGEGGCVCVGVCICVGELVTAGLW